MVVIYNYLKIKKKEGNFIMADITFKKIDAKFMYDYLKDKSAEEKAAFKKAAYKLQKDYILVDVLDDNGQPIQIAVKDKSGKLTGKYRNKKKRQYIEDTAEEKFDMFEAKMYFCKKYMPHLVPKKQDKKAKTDDLFANW